MPNVQVELGLQKAFLLDDPVAGVIGNTDYVLSGEDFVDISEHVYSVSITRGKNRDLDKYVAGSVSVDLNNETRLFDPKNTSSPYIADLVPRRGIRVSLDSVPSFTGKVTDWNLSYAPGGQSKANVSGADAFTLLANQVLTPGTATVQQTGARIEAILNMPSVNWPTSDRRIDTGLAELGADIWDDGQNALTYLQEVELSEGGGNLFISKEGYLTFRDRSVSPATSEAIVFSDDGAHIPFTAANIEYGTENLYNEITVTCASGTAVASDANSQAAYGISALSLTSLVSDLPQAQSLADFLLKRYKNPEYRFQSLTINLDGLETADRVKMLELELGDVARVIFTPNGIGDPIDVYNLIIRINHTVSTSRHDVTLGLGAIQSGTFIIGDPVFGTIGEDALGVLAF